MATMRKQHSPSKKNGSRANAFLDRFARNQAPNQSNPNFGTRTNPTQQNTFSASQASSQASQDFFSSIQKGQGKEDRVQRQEEKDTAMFRVRNLIKERNNILRQVMNKHRFNKSMQSQLKQAQKRHNGHILNLLQEGSNQEDLLLDRLKLAHNSHSEVVASLSKHGGATPLSVVDFIGTLNDSHSSLITLVHMLSIFYDDGTSPRPSIQQQQIDFQQAQENARRYQQQQEHMEATQRQEQQQAPREQDLLDQHTEEAHADLSAAHKVNFHVFFSSSRLFNHNMYKFIAFYSYSCIILFSW